MGTLLYLLWLVVGFWFYYRLVLRASGHDPKKYFEGNLRYDWFGFTLRHLVALVALLHLWPLYAVYLRFYNKMDTDLGGFI